MEHASIERPLGPTEEMYWRFDALSPLNFVVTARLEGALAPEALENALAALQVRHPLLRVRVERDAKGHPWFRTSTGHIPLRVFAAPPEERWARVEEALNASIDTDLGPLLNVVWLQHGPEDGTLAFVFHHAISDGRSATFLLRDLLRSLAQQASRETPALEPLPPAGYYGDRIPPFDPTGSLQGLEEGWKTLKAAAHFMRRVGLPVGLQKPAAAVRSRFGVIVEARTLRGEALRRLVARAKEENTTVQCVLNAALSLTVAEDSPPGPLERTSCTQVVDIRARLVPPVGEDCGLFATGLTSLHQPDHTTEFWPFAREIRRHMDRSIATPLPFFHAAMHALVTNTMRGVGIEDPRTFSEIMNSIHPEGLAVSNLGRVDIAVPGSPVRVTELCFATNTSVLNDLSTSAMTYGGCLTWAFNGRTSFGRARLVRIADRAMERIAEAVGPS